MSPWHVTALRRGLHIWCQQPAAGQTCVPTGLAVFFDHCSGPVADAVDDQLDDSAAADWIPILPDGHAQTLTVALDAADRPGVNPNAPR